MNIPSSPITERHLLGCCLALGVSPGMTDSDFHNEQYRVLNRAMNKLGSEGKPIDLVTVNDAVSGMVGAPDPVHLSSLLTEGVDSPSLEEYRRILKRYGNLRRLFVYCQNTLSDLQKVTAEQADQFVTRAQTGILNLCEIGEGGAVRLGETIAGIIPDLEYRMENKIVTTGIPFGFRSMDNAIAGQRPGNLIIVAARPGMGKTSFVTGVMKNAARGGDKAILFSLEMTKEEIGYRMLAEEARVDLKRLIAAQITMDEYRRIAVAGSRLFGLPLYVEDRTINVMEMRHIARKERAEWIGIDYLQIVPPVERRPNREREVAEISSGCKAMAKDLRVPVVLLSQLNRKVEERSDKRPIKSDLRESGAIEQDADVIIFINREEAYMPDTPNKGIAEIIIDKNRNGPPGVVKLAWIGQYSCFADLEYGYER